jgi:hypothetical protein
LHGLVQAFFAFFSPDQQWPILVSMRYIVAILLIALGLAGCSHAPAAVPGPSADAQVCSHVNPAPYVMYPGGDWNTPAVAAVAQGASPLVRDAYFAAASAPFPEMTNWAETFPPYQQAMSRLATVCAEVRTQTP